MSTASNKIAFFIFIVPFVFCSGERGVVDVKTVIKGEDFSESKGGFSCESTIFYGCHCELKEEKEGERQSGNEWSSVGGDFNEEASSAAADDVSNAARDSGESKTEKAKTQQPKTSISSPDDRKMNNRQCKSFGWRDNIIENRSIFIGIGHCLQNKSLTEMLSPSEAAASVIEYYLRVLRVDCIPDLRMKIYDIVNEELLVLSDDKMHFELNGEINQNIINSRSISKEHFNKLYMAFELSAFSKAYHQMLERNLNYTDYTFIQTPGGHYITRSIKFLTEMTFEYIVMTIKLAPSNLYVKLLESFERILKTVLLKLHQDETTIDMECKQEIDMKCLLAKKLIHGDKFRMTSLILFIRHSTWGQVKSGHNTTPAMPLQKEFYHFVKENKIKIRENIAPVLLSD